MKAKEKMDAPVTTCAIIDAACIFGDVETTKNLQSNFLSLFMGKEEELLSAVAPYLFPFQFNTEFGKWLLEKGWGNAWGLFLTTKLSMEDLREHFRKFLMVKTDEGKEIYFRFYDPRVLRVFLPSCDEQQLEKFFGLVDNYTMEDENSEYAVKFSLKNKKLIMERMTRSEFMHQISNGEMSDTIQHTRPIQPPAGLPADNETKSKVHETPILPKGWSFLMD